MPATLRIKLTAKRQATFPAAALRALKAGPGDYLVLIEDKNGWRIAAAPVDHARLAPLRARLVDAAPAPLHLAAWRDAPKDHARLRD